jgi:predicted nucleic acid-binding protein
VKTLFADALYWIALINPKDQWHGRVRETARTLGQVRLVTTEEVLTEVLNFYAEGGQSWRAAAASGIRAILANPLTEVLPVTHKSFLDGLALYEARPDKGYSLTDCVSMLAMRERGIGEVLTHDHHFEQEGFTILL